MTRSFGDRLKEALEWGILIGVTAGIIEGTIMLVGRMGIPV